MARANIDLWLIDDSTSNIAASLVNQKVAIDSTTDEFKYKTGGTIYTAGRKDKVLLLDGTQAMTATLNTNGNRIKLHSTDTGLIGTGTDLALDVAGVTILTIGASNILAAQSFDLDGNELILDADGDTSLRADVDDTVVLKMATVDVISLAPALFDINSAGGGTDTRIQGSGTTNLFYVDASTDRIGIGVNTPDLIFNIAKSAADTTMGIDTYHAGTSGPILYLRKSETDSIGSLVETVDTRILGSILFQGVRNISTRGLGARIQAVQNGSAGATYIPTDLYFRVSDDTINYDNALIIKNDSKIGMGLDVGDITGKLHIATTASNNVTYLDTYSTTDAERSYLRFRKSATATISGLTVTADNEDLGTIDAVGVDSVTPAFTGSSAIKFVQDGAAGSGYVPGRIEFHTALDGAYTERMYIMADGKIGMGIEPTKELHLYRNSADVTLYVEGGSSGGDVLIHGESTFASSDCELRLQTTALQFGMVLEASSTSLDLHFDGTAAYQITDQLIENVATGGDFAIKSGGSQTLTISNSSIHKLVFDEGATYPFAFTAVDGSAIAVNLDINTDKALGKSLDLTCDVLTDKTLTSWEGIHFENEAGAGAVTNAYAFAFDATGDPDNSIFIHNEAITGTNDSIKVWLEGLDVVKYIRLYDLT